MMRHFHHLLIATALWAFAAGGVCAAGVKVIANASVAVSSVSVADLKSIFLATKTSFSDGSRVEPVLLKSGSAHEIFVKQYMGKTDTGLEMYYRSLVFTGKGSMPKSLASDAEMVDYVARTKGAIGYVSGAANTDRVRVLEVR
jgi:ABC-type phosphate transport system substrate-binding protein